ncbi:MAG: cobalamin adenosyltransferase [Gammaproteobacteria bacterium]|nr:MAG: cobalamin adenosyltransferase [Gammaproteobacteria bacterium]
MNVSITQQVIHWQAAQAVVNAAIEKAESLDIKINVAVVDSSGNPAAFLRMPGAFIHSIDIAKDKAYTAASFGMTTDKWKGIFEEEKMLKIGMPNRKRLIVFGGGMPIVIDGQIIGAVGVSGGSESQDIECAMAAIESIK